ncbi:MAG: hypothetical protein K940chlam9_01816 [Chlamydiae bacterium]|nr:hypothetical protein [Chlamydiota bacterium]
MTKPIEESEYRKYLKKLGFHLRKGGIDYNLYTESGGFLCSIKIIHSRGKKREVSPSSVRKTEKICKERGLKWPPKKK